MFELADEASAWVQSAKASLRSGRLAEALELLSKAEAIDPRLVSVKLTKALAYKMKGENQQAIQQLDEVLEQEPYHFVALLSKGALLEKLSYQSAALTYRRALAVAPSPTEIQPSLAAPLMRARKVVETETAKLAAHILLATADIRARFAGQPPDRFYEALDIFVGAKRAYRQEPQLLNYPSLPAIPFYDRALFPWLKDLEAATATIQAEFQSLLKSGGQGFAPYIQYSPGTPINQWGELNRSPRWSAYFFWKDGVKQEDACLQAPRTAKLLEMLPVMRQPGFAPTVNFSVLEPHTHIPPHTGSANTRLLAHLPIVLPGPARFRVGNVTREWRLGEAWVFDDTIEHEAWNDADEARTILIFDVWSPFISEAERELIGAMMAAKNAFYFE